MNTWGLNAHPAEKATNYPLLIRTSFSRLPTWLQSSQAKWLFSTTTCPWDYTCQWRGPLVGKARCAGLVEATFPCVRQNLSFPVGGPPAHPWFSFRPPPDTQLTPQPPLSRYFCRAFMQLTSWDFIQSSAAAHSYCTYKNFRTGHKSQTFQVSSISALILMDFQNKQSTQKCCMFCFKSTSW